MLSKRTKISLAQFLGLLSQEDLVLLCEKHGVDAPNFAYAYDQQGAVRTWVEATSEQSLLQVLDEVVRTNNTIRSSISPKYRFDERWDDLVKCLALDGYLVAKFERTLRAVDPSIEGSLPVDDDLTLELKKSQLKEADEIVGLLAKSSEAYRSSPADFNGCLNNARVALETLARGIAKRWQGAHSGSFDETKWGQVLAFLRTSGLVTKKEEEGLAGVYGFVSPGSHNPIGLSEEEMVRLGRSLIAGMAYFLIKRYNAGP